MNPVHQYPNHTSNTKLGIFPPPETGLQTIQLNYIKHSTHTKTPPTVSRPDKAVTGFKDNALLIWGGPPCGQHTVSAKATEP